MSKSRSLHLLLCMALLACELSLTANRAVEIGGEFSIEQKVRIADAVIAELDLSKLRVDVAEQVPSLEMVQLRGLTVESKFLAAKELSGHKEPDTRIFVQCSYRYSGEATTAEIVVNICKERVAEAVERVVDKQSDEPSLATSV